MKIGDRFGSLTILRDGINKNKNDGHKYYVCKCDCGKIINIRASSLRKGQRSCGCLQREILKKINTKHNMYGTRIYRIWNGILSRTKYKSPKEKERYWGRGITVCKEWEEFDNFYKWSCHSGYSDDLTIDRIDNDKGYYPDNCRWATPKQQAKNRSNNVIIDYKNNKITLSELAKKIGISATSLSKRLCKMSVENAVNKKKRKNFKIRYLGNLYNLKEICELLCLNYKYVSLKHRRGKSLKDIINADIEIIQEATI